MLLAGVPDRLDGAKVFGLSRPGKGVAREQMCKITRWRDYLDPVAVFDSGRMAGPGSVTVTIRWIARPKSLERVWNGSE